MTSSGKYWEVSDIILDKIEGKNYLANKENFNTFLHANPWLAKKWGYNTFKAD